MDSKRELLPCQLPITITWLFNDHGFCLLSRRTLNGRHSTKFLKCHCSRETFHEYPAQRTCRLVYWPITQCAVMRFKWFCSTNLARVGRLACGAISVNVLVSGYGSSVPIDLMVSCGLNESAAPPVSWPSHTTTNRGACQGVHCGPNVHCPNLRFINKTHDPE